MIRQRFLWIPLAVAMFAVTVSLPAQGPVPGLRIDVPTTLNRARVVVDVGHLTLNGDMPYLLGDIHLLADGLRESKADGEIVMVFHGDAAYLVLDDATYNANRHVTTGNPFKSALSQLMGLGVRIELCGATAIANHWSNSDLLQGVKVNVNAMVRITQLEQNGYTLIYQ